MLCYCEESSKDAGCKNRAEDQTSGVSGVGRDGEGGRRKGGRDGGKGRGRE